MSREETFLKAHRNFAEFRGESEPELLGWLRRILATTVANLVRHFRGTAQRDVRLERQMADELDQSSRALDRGLAARGSSPSEKAQKREQAVARGTDSPFRLFHIQPGGSLTLVNVTLSNGWAQGFAGGSAMFLGAGGGSAGLGGAILNQGNLVLQRSTLSGNLAVDGTGWAPSRALAAPGAEGEQGGLRRDV